MCTYAVYDGNAALNEGARGMSRSGSGDKNFETLSPTTTVRARRITPPPRADTNIIIIIIITSAFQPITRKLPICFSINSNLVYFNA